MKWRVLLVSLLMVFSALANAQVRLEVTRGKDDPTPIAIVPFEWVGPRLPEDVPAIVRADMHRSGQFEPIEPRDMLSSPRRANEVVYRDWRAIKAEYLVIGRMAPQGAGVGFQYELFDVLGQRLIMTGSDMAASNAQLRDVAHRISDRIYEKITGIRGAFSTKLLYVSQVPRPSKKGGQYTYRIMLSDIDGARERVVRESRLPLGNPSWSPSGDSIVYVSFETRRPGIYLQNLRTGRREQLTKFKGLNSSPSFSPDGRRVAMVLSKDGNPDIYVMDIASRQLTRVTNHFAIDTEPSWMPDGRSILFTSDRGGRPQVYKVTLGANYTERMTFEGDYNARPRVLPDGSGFVFVHRNRGAYNIALHHFRNNRLEILTRTQMDESPSIAPNGTMLVYATIAGRRSTLAAVSVDGGVKYQIPTVSGEVRMPAWSPFPPK